MVDRQKLLGTLRDRLHEAFMARYGGAPYARIARATGYADGYLQALADAGVATDRQLLQLVMEERQRALRTEHPLAASTPEIAAAG
jgi:hypothetical protein